ncbi:MAG: hypothetical protein N3D79_00805 [Acidilobaceae archaeon]|nr:hypothetical protein [Acidilobaceae archaeon]
MRKAVSSLVAVLIISLVMLSALSTALTLSSSIRRSSEDSAAKISQIIADSSSSLEIRLDHSQGLSALVVSARPVSIKYFLLEFKNGTLLRLEGGTFENARIRLLENYSCAPVRLHAVLSSGLVVGSRWHSCGLLDNSGRLLSSRDPEIGNVLVVPMGDVRSRTVSLNIETREDLSVRHDCTIIHSGYYYQGRALLRSWNTSIGRVELWARCERSPGSPFGLPLVTYLTIEGPPKTSFSGTATVLVAASTLSEYRLLGPHETRDIVAGVIPLAYSPGGSYEFSICYEDSFHYKFWYRRIEGRGTVDFVDSRRVVGLAWVSHAHFPPEERLEIYMTFHVRLRAVRAFEPAAELNITMPPGSRLELLPLRPSGAEPLTEALSFALRGRPHVEAVVHDEPSYVRDLSFPIYFDKETRVTLRYYPTELSPPALPRMNLSFNQNRICTFWVYGSAREGALPAPWGGPAIVRAGNLTILLGAHQELRVESRGSSSIGYARLLPEAGYSFSQPVVFYPLKWEEKGGVVELMPAERGWRGLALAVDRQGRQMLVRLD